MAITFKMPNWEDHVLFLDSKPYAHAYIIIKDGMRVGNIYLTEYNEIGVFVLREHRGGKIGMDALNLLIEKHPRKRYLANISPQNVKSQEFFMSRGFKLIEYTYELKIT